VSEITAPPRWIRFLLWPFKGEPCYPQIEGDLAEEFQQRIADNGIRSARLWYYKEVCRNLLVLTCRWVTITVIIFPLLCSALHIFLYNKFRLFWGMENQPFSWIFLFFDFHISSLIGLSLGAISSRLLIGHGRMIGFAFGLYYLAILGLLNASLAINIRRGIRILVTDIPQLLIHFEPSFMLIWTLICVWVGIIWIERNRRHCRPA
jgi:hypothetical protein